MSDARQVLAGLRSAPAAGARESFGPSRCRVVSRYRCAGFAMDRRMPRGIRDRVTTVAAPNGDQ